jgi:hypothetical protein
LKNKYFQNKIEQQKLTNCLERSSLLSVKQRKYERLVYYTNTNHIYRYTILLVLRVERDKKLDKEDKESMTWWLSYNSGSCIYIYVCKSIEKKLINFVVQPWRVENYRNFFIKYTSSKSSTIFFYSRVRVRVRVLTSRVRVRVRVLTSRVRVPAKSYSSTSTSSISPISATDLSEYAANKPRYRRY